MSKKDYQAIARAFYKTKVDYVGTADSPRTRNALDPQALLADLTWELCDILAADNPRFSRERFTEACETGKCKGMRQ